MRLYKLYGDGAMEMVKNNPYLIATDRVGGQFDEADAPADAVPVEEKAAKPAADKARKPAANKVRTPRAKKAE